MRRFNHTSGTHLKIGDASVYYEVVGDQAAPVLLLLHGGLGNIDNFNDLIPMLPDNLRILGIDCRGHGKSTLGSKPLTYELLQKDVEAILDHLQIHELTILGFSNGGTIAYRLTALAKLNVTQLITIGAPWCSKHSEHLRDAYSKLTSEMWKERCPEDFESYKKLNPVPQFDALFRQSIEMALDKTATGRPDESVQHISCPTLIVRGENDPIVSFPDIVELSKFIKNSQILNILSAGHEAFQDQLDLFAIQLKKFLSD